MERILQNLYHSARSYATTPKTSFRFNVVCSRAVTTLTLRASRPSRVARQGDNQYQPSP